MPIYEYRCTQCEHQFQRLIRNPDDLPRACPQCGAKPLKKLFSTFSPAMGSSKLKTPCDAGACPGAREGGLRSPCAAGRCPF